MQNRSFIVRDMENDCSSSSEEECLAQKAVALTYRQRKHRVWVRNAFKKKDIKSYKLIEELAIWDREMCFRCMRMTSSRLEHLLCLVAPQITKQVTNYRKPIPPEQRLSLTLRHLATGESHISLSLQYRIGRQTIHNHSGDLQGHLQCSSPYLCKYTCISWRLAHYLKTVWSEVELATD